jgi:hypothetical protein
LDALRAEVTALKRRQAETAVDVDSLHLATLDKAFNTNLITGLWS